MMKWGANELMNCWWTDEQTDELMNWWTDDELTNWWTDQLMTLSLTDCDQLMKWWTDKLIDWWQTDELLHCWTR